MNHETSGLEILDGIQLEQISINVPCSVPWGDMRGDERTRFCGQCRQKVYNISAMSRGAALALVRSGSPACIRILRRPDGTVVTRDCRKVLREMRQRVFATACMVAALVLGLLSMTGLAGGRNRPRYVPPGGSFWTRWQTQPPMPALGPQPAMVFTMGDMAIPPQPATNITPPPSAVGSKAPSL